MNFIDDAIRRGDIGLVLVAMGVALVLTLGAATLYDAKVRRDRERAADSDLRATERLERYTRPRDASDIGSLSPRPLHPVGTRDNHQSDRRDEGRAS